MLEKRINKSDRAYEPTPLDMFAPEINRAQKQQIKIIEAAIDSFSDHGIDKTTYAALARHCDVSRPLIHHYFPALEDLVLMAAKYTRSTLQNLLTEGLHSGEPHPRAMLHGYCNGYLKWLKLFPNQGKFWIMFHYHCAVDPAARKENTTFSTMNHLRLQSLLLAGKEKCGWKFDDVEATAKTIQIVLLGTATTIFAEDGYFSLNRATKITIENVERYLGSKK